MKFIAELEAAPGTSHTNTSLSAARGGDRSSPSQPTRTPPATAPFGEKARPGSQGRAMESRRQRPGRASQRRIDRHPDAKPEQRQPSRPSLRPLGYPDAARPCGGPRRRTARRRRELDPLAQVEGHPPHLGVGFMPPSRNSGSRRPEHGPKVTRKPGPPRPDGRRPRSLKAGAARVGVLDDRRAGSPEPRGRPRRHRTSPCRRRTRR